MTKLAGPLHPLPVPEDRGTSVTMDFISLLPEDEGKNCILTLTDQLGGADIQLIPTRTDIDAEDLASLFFDHWYCENRLPLDIISDHNKLFMSKFWKALHILMGVKLKMSTSFHLETDGTSERTNKLIVQSLRYYVQQNQKGWVKALPKVCFKLMNMIKASSGLSLFQLRMSCSPRLIPPIVPTKLGELENKAEGIQAVHMLTRIADNIAEAQDNLLFANVIQTLREVQRKK